MAESRLTGHVKDFEVISEDDNELESHRLDESIFSDSDQLSEIEVNRNIDVP